MKKKIYLLGLLLMVFENGAANCANDPYFGDQWGLKNTGQSGGTSGIDIKACEAWQISTGKNITVAVVDMGIYFTHPDLAANEHPLSFDCERGTSPQVIYSSSNTPNNAPNRGTRRAGIIGAVKNNIIGIAGVAPDCKLMSISTSLLESARPNIYAEIARGINWAWQNGVEIGGTFKANVEPYVICPP